MATSRPKLVDLSNFGIHAQNSGERCCRCGQPVRGWSEAIFADELCGNCSFIEGKRDGRHIRVGRREAAFYRPRSVHVLHPQMHEQKGRLVWEGVVLPQRAHRSISCVVRIDGDLYTGRDEGGYVALHDVRGNLCRAFGLQLSQKHLAALYQLQK
jgi:hypothetical protein